MNEQLRRIIIITVLAAVAVCAISYSANKFSTEKEAIVLQLSDFFQKIALPYKLARLSLEPRETALLIPIDGLAKRNIADTWGEARSQGRTHEGTDIFAKRGTPIFSATRGYVVRVGTNALGGNIIFVYGPGGARYYYAHLESVAKGIEFGKEVTTDTVLGFVGNTGNASGTPPHLHFGMYYNRGAENPYALLTDRL